MSDETPLLISKSHKLSWGQQYVIYDDRIELRAKILFRTLKIPFSSITEIDVMPKPGLGGLFKHPLHTLWAYNNDWAGFNRHVYIKCRIWPRRIKFVPEDPDKFVAICQQRINNL